MPPLPPECSERHCHGERMRFKCISDILTRHDDDLPSQIRDVRNVELGLRRIGLSQPRTDITHGECRYTAKYATRINLMLQNGKGR
jgi:hypothetical protein